MKKLLGLVVLLMVTATPAFAGWGAIACNARNMCRVSYGWPTYNMAVNYAVRACGTYSCRVVRWEHNACVAYGRSRTCN